MKRCDPDPQKSTNSWELVTWYGTYCGAVRLFGTAMWVFFPLSSSPNYRTGQGGRDRNAYFVQNIKKLILDDQEIE